MSHAGGQIPQALLTALNSTDSNTLDRALKQHLHPAQLDQALLLAASHEKSQLNSLKQLVHHGASPQHARLSPNSLTVPFPENAETAGWTALHFAAARNHIDVIKFLLSHGASISAIGTYGQTAEAVASQHHSHAAVTTLREWSIDDASTNAAPIPPPHKHHRRLHPQKSLDNLLSRRSSNSNQGDSHRSKLDRFRSRSGSSSSHQEQSSLARSASHISTTYSSSSGDDDRSLSRRPLTAPVTKTSFDRSEVARSRTGSMSSDTGSFNNPSPPLINLPFSSSQLYRPRKSSLLRSGGRTPQGDSPVFDDDDDAASESGMAMRRERRRSSRAENYTESAILGRRDSVATISTSVSSRRPSTSDRSLSQEFGESSLDEENQATIKGRDQTLLPSRTGRSSRSNSISTESSSSLYDVESHSSGPNSSHASLQPWTARQPAPLSPLYELPAFFTNGAPGDVHTVEQARSNLQSVEKNLLNFKLASAPASRTSQVFGRGKAESKTVTLSEQLREYGKAISLEKRLREREASGLVFEVIKRGGTDDEKVLDHTSEKILATATPRVYGRPQWSLSPEPSPLVSSHPAPPSPTRPGLKTNSTLQMISSIRRPSISSLNAPTIALEGEGEKGVSYQVVNPITPTLGHHHRPARNGNDNSSTIKAPAHRSSSSESSGRQAAVTGGNELGLRSSNLSVSGSEGPRATGGKLKGLKRLLGMKRGTVT